MSKHKSLQLKNNIWFHYYFSFLHQSNKFTEQEKKLYKALIKDEKLNQNQQTYFTEQFNNFIQTSETSYQVMCFFSCISIARFLSEQFNYEPDDLLPLFGSSFGQVVNISELFIKESNQVFLNFEKITPLLNSSLSFNSDNLQVYLLSLAEQFFKQISSSQQSLNIENTFINYKSAINNARNAKDLAKAHNDFFNVINLVYKLPAQSEKSKKVNVKNERQIPPNNAAQSENKQDVQVATIQQNNPPRPAPSADPLRPENTAITSEKLPNRKSASKTRSCCPSKTSAAVVVGSAGLGGFTFAGIFIAMVKLAPFALAAGATMGPVGLAVMGLITVAAGIVIGGALGCAALFFANSCNKNKRENRPNSENTSLINNNIK
ncbi:MAG: hypothetical protein HKM04_04985 [Legionellales bacterium]|nr:hypothetical protein [Legionellales bacterium]